MATVETAHVEWLPSYLVTDQNHSDSLPGSADDVPDCSKVLTNGSVRSQAAKVVEHQ
jgi:hypothetical protein